ncbi:MAG: hypothetical protein ICV69_05415 [Thermoleophilaceae bacterium]|nr:hypothetical protein [Thermoleophilaceae bacterium]
MTEDGYEYNLVLLAAIFALTEAGPGPISLDRALGTERWGMLRQVERRPRLTCTGCRSAPVATSSG